MKKRILKFFAFLLAFLSLCSVLILTGYDRGIKASRTESLKEFVGTESSKEVVEKRIVQLLESQEYEQADLNDRKQMVENLLAELSEPEEDLIAYYYLDEEKFMYIYCLSYDYPDSAMMGTINYETREPMLIVD